MEHNEHWARARSFAGREIAGSVASRDRGSRWDDNLFRSMGEAGLLGAGLPRAHGGSELGALDVSHLLGGFGEGSGDAGLALAWVAHAFGCAAPILRFGTEAQRRRYLPALGSGESIGAVAHAESPVQGDPIGIQTRATRRGDRWILRGQKTWVVNGVVGRLFVVTVVTDPARHKEGVSTFLVEKDAPGLRIGRRIETMGARTATLADLTFDDCEVPADSLLGAEGTGLTHTYRLIQRSQRGLLFAPWIGLMRSVLDQCVAHAKELIQLGRPLAHSQSTRATLADMKIRHELCRRLQVRAAFQLDRADLAADRDIAVARLFLARSVADTTRDALQIHGARGGEVDCLTERLYRDATVAAHLGEGSEILRSVIAGSLLHLG
jgi:alkylation response protein AidB-like acyl-CoA dehydrogenase